MYSYFLQQQWKTTWPYVNIQGHTRQRYAYKFSVNNHQFHDLSQGPIHPAKSRAWASAAKVPSSYEIFWVRHQKCQAIAASTKWQIHCRQLFQMHFHWWRNMNLGYDLIPAAIIITIQDNWVLVFHKEVFQLPVPSMSVLKYAENIIVFSCWNIDKGDEYQALLSGQIGKRFVCGECFIYYAGCF